MEIETEIAIAKRNRRCNWWRRKTAGQKGGILLTCLSIFAALLLIYGLVLLVSKTKDGKNIRNGLPEICSNQVCLDTAEELKSAMDFNVNPCNNFYEFVCGNWSAKYPIGTTNLASSTFINIQNQVTMNVLDLLTEAQRHEVNDNIVEDVLRFYERCQDTDTMEKNGLEPLRKLLKETLGGWPVAHETWHESYFDINKALTRLHELGFMNLMDISVDENIKDGLQYVFMVDQPKTFSFGVDWGTLTLPAIGHRAIKLGKYRDYIANTVDIISGIPFPKRDQMTIEDDISELVDFESLIARTIAAPGTRRDVKLLLNETTVGEFRNLFKQWDPMKVFNGITKDINYTVVSKDNMYPVGLPYLLKLDEIISETPTRTVANFMGWVIVRSLGGLTVNSFRDVQLSFMKIVEGIEEQVPRNVSCLTTILDRLPFSMVGQYVKKFTKPTVKTEIEKMISEVKKSVLKGLKSLSWMDNQTKQAATQKVESVVDFVAYPDWVLDEEKMQIRHKNIIADLQKSESFLEDIVVTKKYLAQLKLLQLKSKPDRTTWGEGYLYPLATNAEYHNTNSIRIMAGILGKALFQQDRPMALNYGSMGSVIGHEIIHGLDDRGSSFDEIGVLRDWWQETTERNYKKKTKCIEEQYNNITDPLTNLKLNGLNTLGENIADNGGIRQAYRAYQSAIEGKTRQRLVNMETFDDKQLFFISYAHIFCEDFRKSYASSRILQETHSLSVYRVNEPLKNFQSFSEVFQCVEGTKMNPGHKCSIWI